MSSSLKLERKQKKFFKSISNSRISLSFLLICSWNDNYVHALLQLPRKLYSILDQNGQNLYPVFRPKNAQKDTIPFGATHTKSELCGLYKGRYPPGFTWSYLLSVSSNYHPAICFGMLTTCPLVAIKTILWKRIPFPRNFFQLYLYLWRWPILNYFTMAESQNSWKYNYLYYVILKIKVRVGMKKLHWPFVVTEKQSYLLPGQTVKKTRVNEVMQW